MIVLALDTSTLRAALAVGRADGPRFTASTGADRRHGRELVPAIRDLLRQAGLAPRDLGAIAVGLGPGSYTGLRVGVTAAKMLSYATGARLFGLDSLEFFARALGDREGRVTALSDAQRGDFHVAEFLREGVGSPLLRDGPTRIASAEEIARSWDGPRVVTGPGLGRWDRPWPEGVVPTPLDEPDPGFLLEMARVEIEAGRDREPAAMEPVYLRRSAAEDQWKGRPAPGPPS